MPTAFQQKVWQACRRIPLGSVSTYKEIAKAIHSKGIRAVGNALNKSPGMPKTRKQRGFAFTPVPCHRVVKNDGSIGGFAWEAKKKIELLKKEGVQVKNGRIVDFEEKFYQLNNLKQ